MVGEEVGCSVFGFVGDNVGDNVGDLVSAALTCSTE